MPLCELDLDRLRQAQQLAESAIGLSEPNPRVGCVIGHEDGRVLGQGHTQRAGEAHAEVKALRDAAGHALRGATAWVTLEPCAHHGRTPPCCDALIEAGIRRVVMACEDPFPAVAGRGAARLRAAGVEVVLAGNQAEQATRELNIGYFARLERGRPWVRLKVAISLDGRTALDDGRSQWITGEAARRDGHAWRRRAGAVVTGVGTVLADDPRLDVRLVPTQVQPLRVVLDSRLRTPAAARILAAPGQTRIYCAYGEEHATEHGEHTAVVELPLRAGQLDLGAALTDLASEAVNEVHIEAGATLNGAWLESRLVDEMLVYLSPRLMGPGRPLATIGSPIVLAQSPDWRIIDQSCCGTDLRIRLRPSADAEPIASSWTRRDS